MMVMMWENPRAVVAVADVGKVHEVVELAIGLIDLEHGAIVDSLEHGDSTNGTLVVGLVTKDYPADGDDEAGVIDIILVDKVRWWMMVAVVVVVIAAVVVVVEVVLWRLVVVDEFGTAPGDGSARVTAVVLEDREVSQWCVCGWTRGRCRNLRHG
jgi:hypothetical protein